MKFDKSYWVVCAVYRMLKKGRIDKQCAINLLSERAKVSKAQATVEMWLQWPLNPKKTGQL